MDRRGVGGMARTPPWPVRALAPPLHAWGFLGVHVPLDPQGIEHVALKLGAGGHASTPGQLRGAGRKSGIRRHTLSTNVLTQLPQPVWETHSLPCPQQEGLDTLRLTPKFAVRRLRGWDLNLHLTVIPKADFQSFHTFSLPQNQDLLEACTKSSRKSKKEGSWGRMGRQEGDSMGCTFFWTHPQLPGDSLSPPSISALKSEAGMLLLPG